MKIQITNSFIMQFSHAIYPTPQWRSSQSIYFHRVRTIPEFRTLKTTGDIIRFLLFWCRYLVSMNFLILSLVQNIIMNNETTMNFVSCNRFVRQKKSQLQLTTFIVHLLNTWSAMAHSTASSSHVYSLIKQPPE
jgi:hypothetical protein